MHDGGYERNSAAYVFELCITLTEAGLAAAPGMRSCLTKMSYSEFCPPILCHPPCHQLRPLFVCPASLHQEAELVALQACAGPLTEH